MNCALKCTECNPDTGVCDLPTATAKSCDKCQSCNNGTGLCFDDPVKLDCSADLCTKCHRTLGGCQPDPVKVNCDDKCTKV